MWVLVASDRAFDTPCLWRVFQINCWNRLMVRASATNSWSRERRAQAIHPARSSSPRRPLVAKTARSCSLSRYARYSAELVVLILARLSCWSSVRSGSWVFDDGPAGVAVPVAGLFQGAAADLVQGLCSPHHDMERIEANRRLRCLLPHDRVDPLRAIGRDMRQQSRSGRPEGVEEQCQGVLVAALVGPHEATGVMVDHTREESVSLPVGNFVDPDAGKPIELFGFPGEVLHDPGDDRRDGPPGQSQEHRHRRQCHVLRQPRAGVLQQVRAFRAGPGPRHVRHQHTVLRAAHPRRRGLQEGACRAGVHRPPPPRPDTGVVPRTRPSALRAPARRPGVRAYRYDQDLAVTVRVRLHRHVADDHALDAHQLPEYPGLAHAVSPPSFRSLSKTKTTAEHGMSHQTRWSGTHYNVTRARDETVEHHPVS